MGNADGEIVDPFAASIAPDAGGQGRERMKTSEVTSPRSAFSTVTPSDDVVIPSTDDISGAAEDEDGAWPHVASLADLQERTLSYAECANFPPAQHETKDKFRTDIHHLCQRTMARVDPAVADEWFDNSDADIILRGLLPHFQAAMRETGLDPFDVLFDVYYYGALECLVGSFLWPKEPGARYDHSMIVLRSETYQLYLKLWEREQQRHAASVVKYFEELKVANASRDEHKEDDATLSPAEKTRVFRNGLNARNQTGWLFYDQTHRYDQIKHVGKTGLNLVQRLFAMNPPLTPAHLLGTMDRCMSAFTQEPAPVTRKHFENGKPPYGVKWHARKGHSLIFFATNLHHIADELAVWGSCGVKVFLNDAGNDEQQDNQIPQPAREEPVSAAVTMVG